MWRQLAADPEAKVVVLTGAGRAFCAGGDLDWITSFLDDPVARDESLREGAQIIDEMLRFPLPVIAAVNGPAVGLGCSLALSVRHRAHRRRPPTWPTRTSPSASSPATAAPRSGRCSTPIIRSREYLFTGDRIPAATAVELGLASRASRPTTC